MKNNPRKILALLVLVTLPVLMYSQPHPNGGNAPTATNNPVGPSAPIGEGVFILIGLAGLYGGKKSFAPYKAKDNNG